MDDNKALLEEITTERKKLVDAVTRQDQEMKKWGETSAKTAGEVKAAHEALVKLAGEYKDVADRLTAWEKKAGRAGFAGVVLPSAERKTIGQQVVSDEGFRAALKSDNRPPKMKMGVTGQMRKALPEYFLFNDGTDTGEAGAAAADYYRVPGIIDRPIEPMRLRDLLQVGPVSTDSVKYVREKNFFNLSTILMAQATAAATTITVKNARGFFAGQIIQLRGATPEAATVLSVNFATNVITLTAALANTHAVSSDVVADTFAGSPEGTLKPNAKVTLENVIANVITLAHGMTASKQILEDVPRLQDFIDQKLMDGLSVNEDYQILYGAGGSDQLPGLMGAAAGSFDWSAMPVGSTKVDAIRRAARIVRTSHYRATGVVLNPVEWEEIETAKASDGHYLYTMRATPMGPVLWGLAVVETTAIREGEALVGAFGLGAKLYDRMMGSISIYEQHEDYAQRNLIYMLAEHRLALEISRPSALCKIDFDEAPEA